MSANMVRSLKAAQRKFFLFAAIAALAGCTSGGSSDSSSSGASVTGTLSIQSASGLQDKVSAWQTKFAVQNTSISVDCGASGIFTASVNATTGAFTATGVPTGVPCNINFVDSDSSTVKCQVEFQDSSSYDLNNNPMSTSSAALTSSVALGSITCDTEGNITIPSTSVSNVDASAAVDSSKAFDFTGVWTAAAFDGTVPTGYQTIDNCVSNCHGPTVGMAISLVRFHGQLFTPLTNCTTTSGTTCAVGDGTVDSSKDGYGMSIWGGDYAHGIGACGGNTGFTDDEARAFAHISLDSTPPSLDGNALTYAHYAWSTPTGFGLDTGWTQPWMYTGAKSQWDIQDCQPVSVPSTSGGQPKGGYACFSEMQDMGTASGTFVWNVGLQNSGGCVDGNNKPVMVSNWASLTGSCTDSASAFNSHLRTQSCTYTGSPVSGSPSITFTCSFTGGAFKDVANATGSGDNNGPDFNRPFAFTNGQWPGRPATIIAQNDDCAGGAGHDEATLLAAAGGAASASQAAAAKELLMRYQCYANAYWQHSSHGDGSLTCSRDYNFNWATNDYAKFVTGDDRSMKPQNAFITDRVFYSSDGQWAFLKNTQTNFQTVPTASGSQQCPMKQMTELKFHRITDNKIAVDFLQTTQMADTSPTCQGAVVAAIAGGGNIASDTQGLNNLYEQLQPQRMVFYLTK
jgi:hypothetical protein